jgi:uncharacterized membrane protein YhaH (DUF805 family)
MNQTSSTLFPARIARVSFLVRYVVFLVAAVIATVMLNLSDHVSSTVKIALAGGAVILLFFLLVALFRSILIPRIRDVGLHPAWSLVIFVPFINFLFVLALLFVPTDAFPKQPNVA